MSLCDVEDHIVPVFVKDDIKDQENKFQYISCDIQTQLNVESTSVSSSTFDEPLIILETSQIDDVDIEDRGCFDENVLQFLPVTPDSLANSITISGQPIVGQTLKCIDHPSLVDKFPICSYEWVASSEFGIRDKYDPQILSKSDSLAIDANMIGKFIACKAYRIVEKQISFQNDYKTKTNVYDPHVNADLVQLDNSAKQEYATSLAAVGPVLICDDWALILLEKLIESHLEFDVQFHIREDILAICGEFRYKHLYLSQIEDVAAKLYINYERITLRFPGVKLSSKLNEIFEIFGVKDYISVNIATAVLNRDSKANLLIENTSNTLNQPYIIEVNNVKPREYGNFIYYICGCFQMSAIYKITKEEWKNFLVQGNLNVVKYLVNKFLSS